MKRGSLSWRNNNPGNIRYGAFAVRYGATGESGGFAVFPNYDAGFKALCALLRTASYRDLTLYNAMHRYAPTSENHTENYINFLERETGFSRNDIIKEIDIAKLARAIQKFEGWIPGSI